MTMNANRINHPKTRFTSPPLPPRPPCLASPYVQGVDLHTNGRLIVAGTEDARCAAERRGQTESGVPWHADEHPAHLGLALGAGEPPCPRRKVDGAEHVGVERQVRSL